MRKFPLTILILALATASSAGFAMQAKTAPAKDSSFTDAEKKAIVNSVLHSAENLFQNPKAPYRAGRLLVLTEYLAQIKPDNPQAYKFLADIYQTQDKLKLASLATERYLEYFPKDYAAQVSLLNFKLDAANTADQRTEVLRKYIKSTHMPATIRAQAAVETAKLLIARGDSKTASKFIEAALELDPLNYSALVTRLDLAKSPTVELKLKTLFAMLKANPRSVSVSRELALLLGELGLHKQCLTFLNHTWKVAKGNKPLTSAPKAFTCEYISCLLDMNKPEQVIKLFGGESKYVKSSEFLSLLAEAYQKQALKNDRYQEKAVSLLGRVARQYETQIKQEKAKYRLTDEYKKAEVDQSLAEIYLKQGWFLLLAKHDASAARKAALSAKKLGQKGEGIELLISACTYKLLGNTKSREADQAYDTLLKLGKKHALANYFLAAHYSNKKYYKKEAQAFITKGLKLISNGLAYRRLIALAKEQNFKTPDHPSKAYAVRKLLKFDNGFLKIGQNPAKAIKVSLTTKIVRFKFGEPVIITAKLTNTSKLPIVIGPLGMVSNRIAVKVRIRELPRVKSPDLPVVILPAARYLLPGQSVSGQVRLDTGKLAYIFAASPLRPLRTTVTAIVSPVETVRGIISDLSSLKPAELSITRLGILPSYDSAARERTSDRYARIFSTHIQSLSKRQQSDSLLTRISAAREVAEILRFCQMPAGRVRWLTKIKTASNRRILRSMFARALADKSPAVRAQALTSFQTGHVNPLLSKLIMPLKSDPAEIVRARLCELLGTSRGRKTRLGIKLFLSDKSRIVKTLAKMFEMYFDREDEVEKIDKLLEEYRKATV